MSVHVSARVWAASKHKGMERLMLLAIADRANDAGFAFPAVKTLADMCGTTPRHANRLLAELRDSGELLVELNRGPHGANLYRVVVEASSEPETPLPAASAPLTPMSPLTAASALTPRSCTPDTQVPKPLTPRSAKPSLNHQEPKKARTQRSQRAPAPAVSIPDVTPQVVSDWQEVRKAKRAGPITPTVISALQREAKKAGLTMQEVLEICCLRSWQSFKASWDLGDRSPASVPRHQTILAADEVFT